MKSSLWPSDVQMTKKESFGKPIISRESAPLAVARTAVSPNGVSVGTSFGSSPVRRMGPRSMSSLGLTPNIKTCQASGSNKLQMGVPRHSPSKSGNGIGRCNACRIRIQARTVRTIPLSGPFVAAKVSVLQEAVSKLMPMPAFSSSSWPSDHQSRTIRHAKPLIGSP